MKKIIEWLQTIQDPDVREKAIRNCENDNMNTGDVYVSSLVSAINGGFLWHKTPEGWGYWMKIVDNLTHRNRLI